MAAANSDAPIIDQRKVKTMMDGMMNGGSMMWGMGLFGLLGLVVLLLAAAALTKYLFFSREKKQRNG